MHFDTSISSCKSYPTDWWFPENTAVALRNSKQALRICEECPNREPCLDYALRNETHGIWGGMREVEREMLRRSKNIPLSERAQSSLSSSARRVQRIARRQNIMETQ